MVSLFPGVALSSKALNYDGAIVVSYREHIGSICGTLSVGTLSGCLLCDADCESLFT